MRAPDATTPVLSGCGLVTALGYGVDATWDALTAGRTAIAPTGDVPEDTGPGLAARIEPPFLRIEVPRPLEPQIKFLNGSGELAVEAAAEAWQPDGTTPPDQQGLWLSQMDAWDWSCIEMRAGFVDATAAFTETPDAETLNRSVVRYTKPFFLLESLKNNAFSFLASWYDLQGANTSTAGFTGATLPLLDLAGRSVARGDLDRALVVASGRATQAVARRDFVLHGLNRPGGAAGYRPLDREGSGLVPGEGAAALGIERRETAEAGGRRILAALLGYAGATGEPLPGVPAPRAETVARAAGRALAEAELGAGDLLGIVLPAVGLPEADAALLEALASLPRTIDAPAVSWRGAFGHLALAADLADLVLAARALETGTLPGTVGLERALEASRPLPHATQERPGRAVLVVSAGLQGEASAVVLGRP